MKDCDYCGESVGSYLKHVKSKHPAEYSDQEKLVLELWEQGVSSRKIAARTDIIFGGGSSVRRVMTSHLTKEELESGRRKMIGKDVREAYASGKRDWVTDLNIARIKSEEGRLRNASGVKLAYAEGRKIPWNLGLNAIIDKRIRESASNISKTMKEKAKNGELKTLLKVSGKGSTTPREEFTSGDRKFILRRAEFSCEMCGRRSHDKNKEKSLFDISRWGLECDHIIPISKGGLGNPIGNGMALCTECHLIKSVRELSRGDARLIKRYGSINSAICSSILGDDVILSELLNPPDKKQIRSSRSPMFYSDEWRGKREICSSIYLAKTGKIESKIHGRKCTVVEVDKLSAKEFFEVNHIAGHVNGFMYIGLLYEGELASVMSFRSPFTKNDGTVAEVARFCSSLNTIVNGGLTKLIKFAKSKLLLLGYKKILTYADLRFGEGAGYLRGDFALIGATRQDYFYTDGFRRYHRFKYRAQPGKSERQVAIEAGVYRVYGRGSNVYELYI